MDKELKVYVFRVNIRGHISVQTYIAFLNKNNKVKKRFPLGDRITDQKIIKNILFDADIKVLYNDSVSFKPLNVLNNNESMFVFERGHRFARTVMGKKYIATKLSIQNKIIYKKDNSKEKKQLPKINLFGRLKNIIKTNPKKDTLTSTITAALITGVVLSNAITNFSLKKDNNHQVVVDLPQDNSIVYELEPETSNSILESTNLKPVLNSNSTQNNYILETVPQTPEPKTIETPPNQTPPPSFEDKQIIEHTESFHRSYEEYGKSSYPYGSDVNIYEDATNEDEMTPTL